MEIQSFNAELAIANLMFYRIFNNIQIKRKDDKGNSQTIPVNCMFGQRSRILKNWQNSEKRATVKLPLIAINRNGYSRNSDRLNNLHNEVKYEISAKNRKYDLLTPIPIDITYDVYVMSKYKQDIDQIASNFMVFFNNDIYVSCQHPKYEGIMLNNQVVMQDNVAEEHQDDIDAAQDELLITTFSFTFKTYLFGGTAQAKRRHKTVPIEPIISTFISNYISVIGPSEIDDFQLKYPGKEVSVILSAETTAITQLSTTNEYDDEVIYDEFTPIVKNIKIGFYPVPMTSAILDYIQQVDQMPEEAGEISGYYSKGPYQLSNETQIPSEEHEFNVNLSNSIYPYVDKMIWKIDENISGATLVSTYPVDPDAEGLSSMLSTI